MKSIRNNRSGFTLLEIIIVIIIVGILASVALPRFFSTVQQSYAAEALSNLATLRHAITRCFAQTRDYGICVPGDFTGLDVENPNGNPNAKFTYTLPASDNALQTFQILATLNAAGTDDWIQMDQDGVKSVGPTGVFRNIR